MTHDEPVAAHAAGPDQPRQTWEPPILEELDLGDTAAGQLGYLDGAGYSGPVA